MLPSRFVFPASNSSASTSDVFPTPRCPATAMLRIFVGSVAAIRDVSSSVASSRIVSLSCRAVRATTRGGGAGRGDVRLEPEDRLRVELRDARLGDAEHLADLAEGQLLVVVERDDELLALGQARDRVGERLLLLRDREGALRVGSALVLDRVDERDLVAAAEPETVQSSSSAAIEERAISPRLSSSSSSVMPSFFAISSSVGRAAEPGLELADRPLDLARAGADGARHPVHRAQLVDDLALDPGHRVRLELDVARRVVALDRADQPEQAVRDEVALVDVGGQPGAEPAGDVLHERRVREDQPVANLLVAGTAGSRATAACVSSARVTSERIRRSAADSSVSSAPAAAEGAQPRAWPARRRRASAAAPTTSRPALLPPANA